MKYIVDDKNLTVEWEGFLIECWTPFTLKLTVMMLHDKDTNKSDKINKLQENLNSKLLKNLLRP